jgi:hypothetical protein
LFNKAAQGARFDRAVHRDDYGAPFLPQDGVGAGLAAFLKSEAAQRLDGISPINVAGQLQATAMIGS